jgi:alkylation response protein AidB-like acyl-CoA dehydrogenase
MGLRGTGSDTYAVQELFVPDAYTLCRDTDEERRQPGPLYQFSTMNLYAAGFAAVALGTARGALDALVALAREKTPSRSARFMRDSPVVQTQLALAEARLQSARTWLVQTLHEIWSALCHGESMTLDRRMQIRLAATFAIHQAKEVVDVAYHEAGATAIFEANSFERRFRDVHSVTQQAQGRYAHFEAVGTHMLGGQPDLTFI